MVDIDDEVARECRRPTPREPDLDLRLAGVRWGVPPQISSLTGKQEEQDVPPPPPPAWYVPPDTDG